MVVDALAAKPTVPYELYQFTPFELVVPEFDVLEATALEGPAASNSKFELPATPAASIKYPPEHWLEYNSGI